MFVDTCKADNFMALIFAILIDCATDNRQLTIGKTTLKQTINRISRMIVFLNLRLAIKIIDTNKQPNI